MSEANTEATDDESDADVGGPLSALARLLRDTFDAKGMMLLMLDRDNDIALGTSGFNPASLPSMLAFVRKIVIARNRGQQPMNVNRDDIVHAGNCPSCSVGLMFPREPFQQAAAKYVVCQCGSFLVPVVEVDKPVTMRCLTIEEVAELPDEVRCNLLRGRREAVERAERDAE